MSKVQTVSIVIIIILLTVIAYDSSLGKLLPPKHASRITCDSALTQGLFYSVLLEKVDSLKDLVEKVKSADTVDEINKLVLSGSNINAPRTLWFRSNSDPSACQAQIFLSNAKSNGDNTAYVEFEIKGFIPTDESQAGILESIQVNWLGTQWFKQ